MYINTNDIENLSTFAKSHGEMPFVHLCTAAKKALEGDESEAWAVERIAPVLDKWQSTTMAGKREALRLAAIRMTDCTRPDGAIARSFQP